MLNFFSPWALAGLLLLAVPMVIHLFKPRKTRRTVFTNLRWLKESKHHISRRLQWHQILLFLLRAALVILLVLALARPVLSLKGGSFQSERFIILDRSRTMSYAESGEPTAFARAQAAAEVLLTNAAPGDRTTVIFASRTAEAAGPLRSDALGYLPAVRAAQPNAQDADLSAALATIRAMLGDRRKDSTVELFFLTNNLERSWSQSAVSHFLKEVGGDIRITVINTEPSNRRNAWIASAFLERDSRQRAILHAWIGWTGDVEARLAMRVGNQGNPVEQTVTANLQPGQLTPVFLELPANLGAEGTIARLELDFEDGLLDDNVYWLDLAERGQMKVLVIEPGVTQVRALQPGLHLRTALQTLAARVPGSLEIASVAPGELTPDQIASAQLIFWVEPSELSAANLTALENRVRAGAGLALFLGPAVNVSFFNDRLHVANSPETSLSPVRLDQVVQPRGAPGLSLTQLDWHHPILANLFDPTYGDLPQTRFQGYFQMTEPPADDPVRVLARIGNTAPALVESEFGAGRVVIFNTTANDGWSDLPRRSSFVPLLDRLVTFLSGGMGRGERRIGESVSLPLGVFVTLPEVEVIAPSGERLRPTLRRIAGQVVMRLDSVRESGIYTVEIAGSAEKAVFTVQPSRVDSPLTGMNPDLLRQFWAPASLELIAEEDFSEKALAANRENRLLIWPWLIGVGCVVMIAEMFLVHWVCPRLNPSVAEAGPAKRRRRR